MNMNKTILVVDDSLSIRNLLQVVLKDAGYQVLLAEDGKDAIKYLDHEGIRLLITDLHMPVMNGLELIKHVRQTDHYRYLPILFLTTETKGEIKMEAKNAGATGWITKPFSNEKLLQIINRVLR